MGHADGLMDTGGSSGSDEVRLRLRKKKGINFALSSVPFVKLGSRGREREMRNQARLSPSPFFFSLSHLTHLSNIPYALKHSITTAPRRWWIQTRGSWYPYEVRFFLVEIGFFCFPPQASRAGGGRERAEKKKKKLGLLVLASPERMPPSRRPLSPC